MVVGHRAVARDLKQAGIEQLPNQVAGGTAGGQDRLSGTQLHVEAVLGGILVGVGALSHLQDQAGAVLVEGVLVDALHVIGQPDALQAGPVTEGTPLQRLDRLRQADRLDLVQVMEGAVTDGLQTAALLEDHFLHVVSVGESEAGDLDDVLADEDSLDIGSVLGPGHGGVGLVVEHLTGAAEDEAAILVMDEVSVHTGPTGDVNVGRGALHILTVLEQTGLAADDILTVTGDTVLVEVVSGAGDEDEALHEVLVGQEVHEALGGVDEAGEHGIGLVHAVLAEDVDLAVDHIVAGDLLAVHEVVGIIVPTVDVSDTVDVGDAVLLTVELLAAGTAVDAVHQLVSVAGGLGGAPVQDGLTDGAHGTAGMTAGGTGRVHIGHGHLGVVVPLTDGLLQVGDGGIQLGLGVHTDVGEAGHIHVILLSVLHVTVPDLVADGGDGSATIGVPLLGSAVETQHLVPAPGVHGDGQEGGLTGSLAVHTGHSDIGGAGILVQDVLHLEAVEDHHLLQRPLGSGVEPQLEVDGIDAFHLVGIQRDVVLAAGVELAVGLHAHGDALQGHRGNVALGSDHDLTGQLGVVALLVRDFEGDIVGAVGQLDTGGGDLTGGELGGDLVAVHIDLRGGLVQTGEVGATGGILHGAGGDGDGIVVQRPAVDGEAGLILQDQRIGDDGHIAIIHSVGVIQRDVVDVEGDLLSAGGGGGHDELDEGRSVVALRITAVSAVLGLVVGGGHIGVGDLLHVHIHIGPACLGDLVAGQLGEALLHILIGQIQVGGVQRAGGVVLVGVGETGAAAHGLLGDVHPHTQTGAVDALLGIQQGDGITPVVQIGVLPVGMGLGVAVVHGVGQRIVAAVDLTVLPVRQEHVLIDALLHQIAGGSSRSLVDHSVSIVILALLGGLYQIEVVAPVLGIFLTALEVEEDIGALTKGDSDAVGSDGSVILIGSGDGSRGTGALGGSGVDEAVHGTGGADEVVSIGGGIHIRTVVQGGDSEVRGLAVGDHLLLGTEGDIGGMDHIDIDGAHGHAVHGHGGGDGAQLAGGNELAVGDGAVRAVRQHPRSTGRDLGRVAALIGTGGADLDLRIGGIEDIVGGQVGMIEGAVSHCGGDHHQGVGHGTDGTVTAGVTDHQLIGALQLGGVGSGTATVQLHGGHTTHAQHDLGLLTVSKTGGVGLLVAVGHHHHHVAVGLDAHGGTGILGVAVVDDLAVPDQHVPAADRLLDVGGVLAEGALLADHGGAVLQDSEEGVLVAHAIAVDVDALHDEAAGGLTGGNVVVGGVGDGHDVVATLLGGGVGLLDDSSLAPDTGVIIVMVVGLDLHIGVGCDVGSDHVVNDTVAVGVISHDFLLLDAGRQSRGLGRCDRHGKILCGEADHRQDADDHSQTQHERKDPGGFGSIHK